MPDSAAPVLSVIVRRFKRKHEGPVGALSTEIEQAVSTFTGFRGLQSSLSHGKDYCELVTVFGFDTRGNLERWETSAERLEYVKALNEYSKYGASFSKFSGLGWLAHPKARISKIEIVCILIFWITLLGGLLRWLADMYVPDILPAFWMGFAMICVNVLAISYVFLPLSSMALTRVKARFSMERGN